MVESHHVGALHRGYVWDGLDLSRLIPLQQSGLSPDIEGPDADYILRICNNFFLIIINYFYL